MRGGPRDRASEAIERALVVNFVVHAIAMASMAALLLPALPGGSAPSDASRVAYIADHPWLFRIGWVPWHACALCDLWLAIVLLRAPWIGKTASIATLVCTLAAIAPEQSSELLFETRGVALATEAARTGDLAAFLAFEAPVFERIAGWAGLFYTFAGIGWTACLASAGLVGRGFGAFSAITWASFTIVSASPLVPAAWRPSSTAVSAGNAVNFVLLQAWLAIAAERVMRRARPETRSGVHAPWRHPMGGIVGWAIDVVATSRFARALCRRLPVPSFASDITNVVYANYLVPAEKLAVLVPEGLELQRLGPDGAWALFTFLTYQHGHFGPRMLGSLRRLFPSPVHTNWRVHVIDPRTGHRGIHFVTNAIASTFQAIGARLMSEGMPMHVIERGGVRRVEDGEVRVMVDPGSGTAPDAAMVLRPCREPDPLPAPWDACFGSFREFLAYAVPQDRAMDVQPWQGTVSRQEIDLGIPLDACEPLEGDVRSEAARAIAGDAAPICFRVAKVSFVFSEEELDPLPVKG